MAMSSTYPFFSEPAWGGGNTNSNYNLDNANKRVGYAFIADRTESMTGFRVLLGSAGTPGTIQADLYACNADYSPTGSSLATATWTWANNDNGLKTFSAGYTVTAGTAYIVVLKNNDGTPGTNYPRPTLTSSPMFGTALQLISPDGTSWTDQHAWERFRTRVFVPNYTTSGTVGVSFGYSFFATNTGSTGALYNTSGSRIARQAVKVKFPYNVYFHGLNVPYVSRNGSPTFTYQCEVINDSGTVLATGDVYGGATTPTTFTYLSSPYLLTANTDYYLAMRPVAATAGDSSNYLRNGLGTYDVSMTYTGPYQGSFYSTGTSISWTSYGVQLALLPIVEPVAGGSGAYAWVSA